MSTRMVMAGVLCIGLLAACEDIPTGPTGPSAPASAETAEGTTTRRAGGVENRDGRPAPLLQRLLDQAIRKVAAERGPAAARTLLGEIRAEQARIREAAAAAGTPEARRRAANAIQLVQARVIARVSGPPVIERVIGMASDGLAALRARVRTANANGRDTAVVSGRLDGLESELGKAREELRAGNHAHALLHAVRAAEGVHRLTGATRSSR